MEHTAYLLLGSNVGERKQNLEQAIDQIGRHAGIVKARSSTYETEPWGLKEQDFFLNLAIEISTELTPEDLMAKLKDIESAIGQPKETKWGPRAIDIDILYYDDLILETETLKIPHPQIGNRNFVLIPLIEIAGDFIDPRSNMTLDDLYDRCKDTGEVFIYEE